MLHSSSLHYYACYYALLCLLHQQQQAATVTIIIDGATTNEWATRDEYQRLIDSSQGPSGPTTTTTNTANTAPLSIGPPESANSAISVPSPLNGPLPPPLQAQQAPPEQPAASASASSTSRARSPTAQQQHHQQQQQQQQFSNSQQETDDDRQAAAAINLDELQLALDRLDLIERERKEQVQQLNRLQVLEKMAESNVVSALTHGKANTHINNNNSNNNNNDDDDDYNSLSAGEASRSQYPNQQQQQLGPQPLKNRQPVEVAGGARTISDLVPFTDDDLEDPLRRLKERETPRKYCGPQLMDVLDLVCQGRYYNNEYEPKIVNPTIKSKRSINYGANSETIANDQLMQMMPDSASAADASVGTLRGETGRDGGGMGVDGNGNGIGGPAISRRTKLRALARGATLGRGGNGASNGESGGDHPASFINGDKNLRANYGNNLDEIHNQNRHQSQHNQQQHYLSSIDNQNHKHNQNQNHNHNHNHYNDDGSNVRNRHSKMAQYRRIRGASKDCCDRSCYLEELKPYCSKP